MGASRATHSSRPLRISNAYICDLLQFREGKIGAFNEKTDAAPALDETWPGSSCDRKNGGRPAPDCGPGDGDPLRDCQCFRQARPALALA
jgi:hypothetical protein